MSPLDKKAVLQILGSTYYYPSSTVDLRLLAYYAAGGDEELDTIIKWVGKDAQQVPSEMDRTKGIETLEIYFDNWELANQSTKMREDFAARITEVVQAGNWTGDDLPLLQNAHDTLLAGEYTNQADLIIEKIVKVKD